MDEKTLIAKFILFNIDEKDIEIAKKIFKINEINQNLICIDNLNVDLSKNKKLLLALYLHLYAELNNRNIFLDKKLQHIRNVLELTENFVYFCKSKFQSIKHYLESKSALEVIIFPSNELIVFLNSIVFFLKNNSCFKKKILVGLTNREYEHPLDKKALEQLENSAGLDFLVKKVNEYGIEKLIKVNYLGSNIKVSKINFPDIYNALETVCNVLDYSPMPDLYLENGFINAKTMGVENPIIVLSTGCVELMTYDELLFVLGHEVGHIKSQHILYHQLANFLPIIADILGSFTLGMGNIVSVGLQLALLNWQRKSEFTADRAGLLACQNIDAAITAMMKIAGAPRKYYSSLNPDEFKKQAMEFKSLDDKSLEKIAKFVSVLFEDHPWTVERAQQLYKWIESGEYESILNRNTKNNRNNTNMVSSQVPFFRDKFCAFCGTPFEKDDVFCPNCGAKRS